MNNQSVNRALRERIRYASDAFNAYMRGLSIPAVSLCYRYEPGTAEAFLKRCVLEYDAVTVKLLMPKQVREDIVAALYVDYFHKLKIRYPASKFVQ